MLADRRVMSASALDRWTRPAPSLASPSESRALVPMQQAAPPRPLVVTCGPISGEVERLLAGRNVDTISTPSAVQAARLAERMAPVACLISGALDGGDPAQLVEQIARLPAPPAAVVVLDDLTWRHADECRRAGALDVGPVGDARAIERALRGKLPELFTRDARAEAVLSLMVSVGDVTYAAESLDLRETGVAIRDFPTLPIGRRVRLRLAVDDIEVWLDGEVARIFERGGLRVVAVRFVDVDAPVRTWLLQLIAELDLYGPSSLSMGAWRADVRSVLSQTFGPPTEPATRTRAIAAPQGSGVQLGLSFVAKRR